MTRALVHLVREGLAEEPRVAALLDRMGLGGPSYYCGLLGRPGDPEPGTAPTCARCSTLRAMAKQRKDEEERRRPGRPPEIGGSGAEIKVSSWVGDLHVQELVALELELGVTRAGAIRHLIEQSAARRARREGR